MKYGLIGEHLAHSYSPEIHRRLSDYDYELTELAPRELERFMKEHPFDAINVTIPYKRDVIPYLDECSPIAREIGAVNTVVRRNGKLYGYNTDFYGLGAMLRRMNMELKGKKVFVLGSGGTSKTARCLAEHLGAREVLVVSRTAKEGCVTYEEAISSHTDAQILLNTTPVGMYPNTDASPIDLRFFPQLEGVADVIYHPLRTLLVQQAQEMGIPACGGLYMLVMQAVYASAFFLDRSVDEEAAERVYQSILAEKQNIVLFGMPSCGKSTVGAALAKKTGRRFIDTDAVIVKRIGMTIAEFFRREGEAAFRDVEERVLADLSEENGCIIATGGGAVLRRENVRACKKNGFAVFLDRPLEQLLVTDDRPLSNGRDALAELYKTRYPLYCAAADLHVHVTGSAEETANDLRKELSL